MSGFALGFGIRWRRADNGGGSGTRAPDGALTDDDGALLVDGDGAFLLEEA